MSSAQGTEKAVINRHDYNDVFVINSCFQSVDKCQLQGPAPGTSIAAGKVGALPTIVSAMASFQRLSTSSVDLARDPSASFTALAKDFDELDVICVGGDRENCNKCGMTGSARETLREPRIV